MRFKTNNLTLRSIQESKKALKTMFESNKWISSGFYKKGEAVDVKRAILINGDFWRSNINGDF